MNYLKNCWFETVELSAVEASINLCLEVTLIFDIIHFCIKKKEKPLFCVVHCVPLIVYQRGDFCYSQENCKSATIL